MQNWQIVGDAETLKKKTLQQLNVGGAKIALSFVEGQFHAVSGICNHAGGPLGDRWIPEIRWKKFTRL